MAVERSVPPQVSPTAMHTLAPGCALPGGSVVHCTEETSPKPSLDAADMQASATDLSSSATAAHDARLDSAFTATAARPAEVHRAAPPSPRTLPLQAALAYRARRLIAELDGDPRLNGAPSLARRLTPATVALLRWWFCTDACRSRVDNFHPLQREAILHTVLIHETLSTERADVASDDDGNLTEAVPFASGSGRQSVFALPMAHGSGLRWVAQALLVWLWRNRTEVRAQDDEHALGDELLLLTSDTDDAARLRDALFGPIGDDGRRDLARSSLLRHARLFLPPSLRPRLREWLRVNLDAHALETSACAGPRLRIIAVPPAGAGSAGHGGRAMPGLSLFMGDHALADHASGSHALGLRAHGLHAFESHATEQHAPDGHPSCVHAAGAPAFEGHTANGEAFGNAAPASAPFVCRPLRIDLYAVLSGPHAVSTLPAIIDGSPSRAAGIGAIKTILLEDDDSHRLPSLRLKPVRRPGRRPGFSRVHRGQLRIGLNELRARADAFAALDPERAPVMLVVCDEPRLINATVRVLTGLGIARERIFRVTRDASGARATIPVWAEVVVDRLPADCRPDPRICVVVPLRTRAIGPETDAATAPGLPASWREADFADIRSENRERIAARCLPRTLLDTLSLIEHPRFHAEYRTLLATNAAFHGSARRVGSATGDLFRQRSRPEIMAFAQLAAAADAEGFGGDLIPRSEHQAREPTRFLRRRQSLLTTRCPDAHQGWPIDSNGLHRGFLETAEADSAIEAYCLVDPRRYAPDTRDALLERGLRLRGMPDALVLTRARLYLVEFVASVPMLTPPGDDARLTIREWCTAWTAGRTDGRASRMVQLYAPSFWSWKRRGTPLSDLLSALSDHSALIDNRPRIRPPYSH